MAKAADAAEIRPVHGKSRVVLEGGSIDVNGQGTLLTTEECLLSKTQQRNPSMSRKDYEKLFSDYLGIRNVIWLSSGIAGDDTHGHVDDITRFVAPDTVVTAIESDPATPTTSRCEKTSADCAQPLTKTASRWLSSNSPCPAQLSSKAAGFPPATPTSTSPTASSRPGFQRSQRPRRPRHPGRPLPRPRDRRHLFRRFNLGLRRDALHDAATAGRLVVSPQSSVVSKTN